MNYMITNNNKLIIALYIYIYMWFYFSGGHQINSQVCISLRVRKVWLSEKDVNIYFSSSIVCAFCPHEPEALY